MIKKIKDEITSNKVSVIIIIILILTSTLSLLYYIKTKNTKLSVVVLEGDNWYDLGIDYGEKCKSEIQGLCSLLRELEDATNFLDTNFDEIKDKFEKYIPGYLIREMKGVAKGADVEYIEILMINCFAEIMILAQHGDIACTQFCKVDEVGEDTGPIFGRTLDFMPSFLLQNFEVFLVADINGKKWIGHTIAGMVGFLTGMNDDGLVVSVSLVATEETGDGFPMVLAIRHALQQYENVSETAEFFENTTHSIGWNYFMMDKDGDAAVVEVTHKHNNTRRLGDTDEGDNYMAATNKFHSEKMEKRGPESRTSVLRKNRAERLMKREDEFNLGHAIGILRDGYDGDIRATNPGLNSISRKWIRKTFLPSGTLGSFIALPEQEYVVISNGYTDSALWYAVNFDGEVVGPIA